MATLNSTIQQLAARFASELLAAIRGANLEELLAASGGGGGARGGGRAAAAPAKAAPAARAPRGRGGRLPRRTADDVQKTLDAIVALLKKHKAGLRSEQIQNALGLDKREIPRPLSMGLDNKKIVKTGEKRATTYFAR